MSPSTSVSASELMLGQSLLAGRLRDTRAVLSYLRSRGDFGPVALWGDALIKPNAADANFKKPHVGGTRPASPEPLGGLLALLTALYDDDVRAVAISGGLSGYQTALDIPFVYLPHDTVIPEILTVCDIADVAAAVSPRPLRMDKTVDAHNRLVPAADVRRGFAANDRIQIDGDVPISRWLIDQLRPH